MTAIRAEEENRRLRPAPARTEPARPGGEPDPIESALDALERSLLGPVPGVLDTLAAARAELAARNREREAADALLSYLDSQPLSGRYLEEAKAAYRAARRG